MVTLTNLVKLKTKKKKRLGRGIGSGKGGHTSSRGQKGQKSRGKIGVLFEGTKMKKSLLKRLPMIRGRGRLKPKKHKPFVVSLSSLKDLPSGSLVDTGILIEKGLVTSKAKRFGVKILGGGKLSKRLTVKVAYTASAAKKINALGGKIEK